MLLWTTDDAYSLGKDPLFDCLFVNAQQIFVSRVIMSNHSRSHIQNSVKYQSWSFFATIGNGFQSLTIFARSSILDLGSL